MRSGWSRWLSEGQTPDWQGTFEQIKRMWQRRGKYASKGSCAVAMGSRVAQPLRRMGLPVPKPVCRVWLRGTDEPYFIRAGSTDVDVLNEIFLLGEYDALRRHDLGGVRQILDLGANVGLFTRFSRELFPLARTVAVEPDRGNLRVCRMNLSAVKMMGQVRLVRACVAGQSRRVRLEDSSGEWGLQMAEASAGEGGATVCAAAVPELLRLCDVRGELDLVKCDIEGAEREVFADCRAWIGRVRYLLVELHSPYTAEELWADLCRNGGDFSVMFRGKGDSVLLLGRRGGGGF